MATFVSKMQTINAVPVLQVNNILYEMNCGELWSELNGVNGELLFND